MEKKKKKKKKEKKKKMIQIEKISAFNMPQFRRNKSQTKIRVSHKTNQARFKANT